MDEISISRDDAFRWCGGVMNHGQVSLSIYRRIMQERMPDLITRRGCLRR